MLYKIRENSGFSLIETLVAITILTVAIAATLSLARQGLATTFVAKQQMQAFFLAVEGVEFVRHQRDSKVLEGVDWLNGFNTIPGCFDPNLGCTVDMRTKSITSCGAGGCDPLQFNETTNEYGYANGGIDTTHIRTLVLNEIIPDQEVEVTISVTWSSGNLLGREIILQERLFNWATGF